MFNAWRVVKGVKHKRRKIKPPKLTWDPTHKTPIIRKHPLWDKLKRVVGLGTDVYEILEFFDEEGMLERNNGPDMNYTIIEESLRDAKTPMAQFEILDRVIQMYLLDKEQSKKQPTIGDVAGINLETREVSVTGNWDEESFSAIQDYFPLNRLTVQENPVSHSDFSRGDEDKLFSYIHHRLNDNNVRTKFQEEFIGPNPEVNVETFLSPNTGNSVPDGIARTLIGLLKGGNKFGLMITDKYGQYKRKEERIKYEIEREHPFPEPPHGNETVEGETFQENRWRNEPTEEDKERWGWQHQLERTNPLSESNNDWIISSIVKRGKLSGSMKKWYFNGIAVFHGNEPKFWVGMKVKWDDYAEPSVKIGMKSFINKEILDWRKW